MVSTTPGLPVPDPTVPPFVPGSPIYFPVTVVDDFSGLLVDPASIAVTVRAPDGTITSVTAINHVSLGEYVAQWTIPSPAIADVWYFSVATTSGASGGGGLMYGAFRVVQAPF